MDESWWKSDPKQFPNPCGPHWGLSSEPWMSCCDLRTLRTTQIFNHIDGCRELRSFSKFSEIFHGTIDTPRFFMQKWFLMIKRLFNKAQIQVWKLKVDSFNLCFCVNKRLNVRAVALAPVCYKSQYTGDVGKNARQSARGYYKLSL